MHICENNGPLDATLNAFSDHELIFLGTGGGRIHTATQHRRTGGIIYSFNGQQSHIDPGPGAIVYLNKMNIDRLKTKWIIVTHNHTDHQNDDTVIIESVHKHSSRCSYFYCVLYP